MKKVINPERVRIEQYNQELEDAEKEIEAGNFYTVDEVKGNIRAILTEIG
ncbi:hypothetical protein [Pedobacter sp. BS3]|nr:hypothetical protein [Pedobacter sp. BS3]